MTSLALIVEDQLLELMMIMKLLDRENIPYMRATTATEALELATRHLPSVVVTDINLPDMSGIELIKKMRIDGVYSPKCLLVSGDPQAVIQANIARLNIFAVLGKPVPLPVLGRFLKSTLGLGVSIEKKVAQLSVDRSARNR